MRSSEHRYKRVGRVQVIDPVYDKLSGKYPGTERFMKWIRLTDLSLLSRPPCYDIRKKKKYKIHRPGCRDYPPHRVGQIISRDDIDRWVLEQVNKEEEREKGTT